MTCLIFWYLATYMHQQPVQNHRDLLSPKIIRQASQHFWHNMDFIQIPFHVIIR